MISKRSFTMLLKDDLKKRSWLLVMSFLVFCLIFPGVILDNIQGMISIYGETDLSPRFLNALTYSGNNYYALAVVLMAAICALTGFSYIYSRPKLDFYHSLPVKRGDLAAFKGCFRSCDLCRSHGGCRDRGAFHGSHLSCGGSEPCPGGAGEIFPLFTDLSRGLFSLPRGDADDGEASGQRSSGAAAFWLYRSRGLALPAL